ncbi:MAG: hypothetical protein H0U76_22125 [Ktedonobacteraceae bacterium]|nr:hypothetical protein [Ktedonobacteraceae bacterium]
MRWEDIQQGGFDETDEAHVQALKARCLQGGQTVYAAEKRQGWAPSNLAESAEAFACNISIDNRFPAKLLHLEVGGSEYWWKWWTEGYMQAQSSDQ